MNYEKNIVKVLCVESDNIFIFGKIYTFEKYTSNDDIYYRLINKNYYGVDESREYGVTEGYFNHFFQNLDKYEDNI